MAPKAGKHIQNFQTSKIADWFYWSLLAITAANYSIITFTFSGDLVLSGPLKPIAYLRFPIAILGYFWLASIHKRGLGFGKVTPLAIVLMASLLIAMPFSPNFRVAFQYDVWFIFQVMFLLKYVYYLVDLTGYERAKYKLVLPLLIMGLYFLVLTVIGLPGYSIGRPFPAIFTTRVQVAMIVPLFLGGLACCLSQISKQRFIYFSMLGFAVFCLMVIAVSGKRASIICALLVIGAYFVFSMKSTGRILAILLVPIALVVALSSSFKDTAIEASEYTVTRIEKGLDTKTSTSINARFSIWDEIGELSRKYPMGVGINVGRDLVGGGLHNTYLGYLLEAGWLAFFVVIVIVFWSLFSGYFTNIAARREMLFYITLPCALYSMTEYNTAPGQPLFIPLWVGLAYALMPKVKMLACNRSSLFRS